MKMFPSGSVARVSVVETFFELAANPQKYFKGHGPVAALARQVMQDEFEMEKLLAHTKKIFNDLSPNEVAMLAYQSQRGGWLYFADEFEGFRRKASKTV